MVGGLWAMSLKSHGLWNITIILEVYGVTRLVDALNPWDHGLWGVWVMRCPEVWFRTELTVAKYIVHGCLKTVRKIERLVQ